MAIVDVICPHCGKETGATIAPGSQFKGVEPSVPGSIDMSTYGMSKNNCKTCGNRFVSIYET
jgi:rRNA maturation protein Nop10